MSESIPPEKAKQLEIIRAEANQGKLEGCVTRLRSLLADPSGLTSYQLAEAHELLARYELNSDRKPSAMQCFEIASGLFRESGDEQRALYCSLITISTEPQARQDGSFRKLLTEAHIQAIENNWPNLTCICSLFEADFAAASGDMDKAIEFCKKSIDLGDEYRLGWENHTMFLRLGHYQAAVGDLKNAVRSVQQALELARQSDLPWAKRNVLFFLSFLAWMQRDFRECIRCNQAIIDSIDQGSPGVAVEGLRLVTAYRNIGEAYNQLGEHGLARETIQHALGYSQQYGISDDLAKCFATQAMSKLLDCDPAGALEDIQRARKLVTEESRDIKIKGIFYLVFASQLAVGNVEKAVAAWDRRPELPANSEAQIDVALFTRALGLIASGRCGTGDAKVVELAGEWLEELNAKFGL